MTCTASLSPSCSNLASGRSPPQLSLLRWFSLVSWGTFMLQAVSSTEPFDSSVPPLICSIPKCKLLPHSFEFLLRSHIIGELCWEKLLCIKQQRPPSSIFLPLLLSSTQLVTDYIDFVSVSVSFWYNLSTLKFCQTLVSKMPGVL